MSVDAKDVEKSLLEKIIVKAAFSAKIHWLWNSANRCSQTIYKRLCLLIHCLLTLAGIAVIIIFSLAPTSGLYWAYRGAQWRVAEDARHTEKLRMERSYQIMEWTYDCTALDAEGQTFAYGIFCHSYAMQSNLSLYKDVDCKTSLGANPTDEEVILTLEPRANCTRGNASLRSGCSDCPSPTGFEYPWVFAVFYVGANLLCVFHCLAAIRNFWHHRTQVLHQNMHSTPALRTGILSRSWSVYFCIAVASIFLDIIVLFVLMDLLGYSFLPYMFCFMSATWICASNYAITDETRFVFGLPDSVFAGGKTDEAEVKRLRKEREKKRMPPRTNCRLCGRR